MKDIVIPYRNSKSEELRYCLRSLKNLPHRNVFICGDRPDFISDKVIFLPNKTRARTAQLDCEMNLRLALEDERLSENFIYMNDDFFIMKKLTKLPNYFNGTIRELIRSRPENKFMRYNQSLKDTAKFLNSFTNPLSYELHAPMVMNKLDRLEISNDILPILLTGKILLPRSIYGNIFCDINEFKKDVKLYSINDQPPKTEFLSTIEHSFSGIVGDYIKSKFKKKSIYEA